MRDGEIDVAAAMGIDEGVDPVRGERAQPLSQAVAVGDRLDAYGSEQVSVTGARDAQDPGTGAASSIIRMAVTATIR